MHRSLIALLAAVTILTAACGGSNVDASAIPELPETTPGEIQTRLAGSTRPVVLNVWASWCIPCRSEAPLLESAAEQFSDRIDFLGVNVRDSQLGAREFIAEFWGPDVPIDHVYDGNGDVPPALGGSTGVPLTFFYTPGGERVALHHGVIDERALALQIDELLARAG